MLPGGLGYHKLFTPRLAQCAAIVFYQSLPIRSGPDKGAQKIRNFADTIFVFVEQQVSIELVLFNHQLKRHISNLVVQ